MTYKQCPWCGRYFTNKGTRKTYCSKNCRIRFNKLLIELEAEREYKSFGRQKPKRIGAVL